MRFLNQSSLSKAKSEIWDLCAFKVLVLHRLVRRYTLYKWIRAYFLLRTEEVPTIQPSGWNTFSFLFFCSQVYKHFIRKFMKMKHYTSSPFAAIRNQSKWVNSMFVFLTFFSFFLVAIYHTVMLSCHSSANRLYSSSFQMLVLYFFKYSEAKWKMSLQNNQSLLVFPNLWKSYIQTSGASQFISRILPSGIWK